MSAPDIDVMEAPTELKRKSVHGGVAVAVSQILKLSLQFISVVVLARLLTPEDYGLFSIVVAITVFVGIFNELGLNWATIQSPEINHRQISALFLVNLAFGCVLALATMAAAPLISRIYREPSLTMMIISMSACYVLSSLGSQPEALLRRQMKFTLMAVIGVSSMAAGFTVAIVAALSGAHYWSLVLMQLTVNGTNTIAVWLAGRWLPGRPGRFSEIKHMLNFGGRLTINQIFNYAVRNVDNLLIGWYWGARLLGFYDKAYQMLNVQGLQVSTPVMGITLPVLSRLQAEPQRYREYYEKFQMLATAAGMSLSAFLFISANEVVLLFLGSQWLPSVPIFRMLAPAAFLGTSFGSANWIFISLGQPGRMFRSSVSIALVTIVGFIIGLPFGALGVAISFSLTRMILLLPVFYYACKKSPLAWTHALKTISRPGVCSISAVVIIISIRHFIPLGQNLFVTLAILALLYVLFFLTLWMILPGGRRYLYEIWETVALLKKKQQPKP
jgi:O-antigen/teichoic acid export membrane protein